MKLRFIALLIALLFLAGCAGSTSLIKVDGKVNQIGSALIQAAVGIALTAKPEAVPPAYAVSTAVLARIDGGSVLLSGLDAAVETEVNKLNLLNTEKASVMDIVGIVRAQIVTQLEAEGITNAESRLIVVRQVIKIVRDSAAARLGVAGGIDWIEFERIVDQALDEAEVRTDAKLGVNEYKAKLRLVLLRNRAVFEQQYATEIAALKGSSI